jgi:RNA polymerase sigma factor FliA
MPAAEIRFDQPTPGDPGQAEAALWELWRSHGDQDARSQLLAMHLPYARVVAASYFRKRFHNEIEFDDYLQLASLGLIESMDRFDPAAGAQFKTFAARRMHGSILDGLERLTEKQQQIGARQRLKTQRTKSLAEGALEANATAHAGDSEGRPQEKALQYIAEAGLAFALAWLLDGTGMVEPADKSEAIPFYRSVELRELRERILDLVRSLPSQERKVIHSHYLQEQPFEEVAVLMGVSKSRVSQLHRQALRRLREILRAPPACDISL